MSRLSTTVKEVRKQEREKEHLRLDETHKNFMGGDCYEVNPLLKLKMITASSIFGEPQYYNGRNSVYNRVSLHLDGLLFRENSGKTTAEIMERAIDEALDYNFEETVEWAVELRETYNMRTNPQIIMVRAALHPKRAEINAKNQKYDERGHRRGSRYDENVLLIGGGLHKRLGRNLHK